MALTIDLNADAGESFGLWRMGQDEALFALVSSVNLACGFHAGDPLTLRRAARLARTHGLAVGAHPGYPDRVGFGRRSLAASPEEVESDLLYQVGALAALLRAEGLVLQHVKAHGALYLDMMRSETVAVAVAGAVARLDAALPLVVLAGPGGEMMARCAREAGLSVWLEAFPDRAYLPNGQLAPRSLPGAVLHDPAQIAARARAMALGEPFEALGGGAVRLRTDTLCLHGDHPAAAENASAVRMALESAGITVAPPSAKPSATP